MSDLSQSLFGVLQTILYIVLGLVFLGVVIWFILSRIRKKKEEKSQFDLTFLQIRLPKENEIEIKAAEQMFSGLTGIRKGFFGSLLSGRNRISFEIISRRNGIGFYVAVPDNLVNLVEKQINGAYPEAEVDLVNPEEVWDRGAYTSIMELKLAGPPHYPIKVYEEMGNDTMNALTSVMSKLGDDEALAVQYVISPAGNSWRALGNKFIGDIKVAKADPEKSPNVDDTFIQGVEKKISKPGFDVVIRVVSLAGDKINAESHLQNISSAFDPFTDVNYNRFKKRSFKPAKKIAHDFIYRRIVPKEIFIPIFDISLYRNTSVLNTEEMATIFHFPNKEVQTPRILWLEARKLPPPSNLPLEGSYLGTNTYRGVQTEVFIDKKDRRRHMYIIGQTGTGKSVELFYLALQDIKAGEGVCIIDPHGNDLRELMDKIPPERVEDVIYFNVADTERPLGLNILEADTDEQRNMLINGFIALLYKLYDPNRTGMIGPQLERTVRNVMLTAMVDPDATMVDVMRMIIDEKYAEKFLPHVTDPLVLRYWEDEVKNTTANRKGETMGYFVSKFDRFVTEKTLRNIIGQPKTALDFKKIMAERKILLIDLSKGKIGEENASFLGLILVPKMLAAAMARQTSIEAGQDFPDFYLYVDEFQNFATPDFATILSEARKYKLNLIVANQFIAQLTEEIKTAVFGNVGTSLAFRVGNDDAEYLAKMLDPVTESDLMNTPVGNFYTKLLVGGHPTQPFSANMPWEEKVLAQEKYEGVADRIKEFSRMTYGKPREEVEAYIKERAGFTDKPEPAPDQAEDSGKKDPKQLIKDLF